MVALLLELGADPRAQDESGWTALMVAAMQGHVRLASMLLASGADLEAKDSDGRTALLRACGEGHTAMVAMLLERGADCEATTLDGLDAESICKDAASLDALRQGERVQRWRRRRCLAMWRRG